MKRPYLAARPFRTTALAASLTTMAAAALAQQGLPMCGAFPADADSLSCLCPPYDDTGVVWGSGPYTADSDICAAAIHAGAITSDGGPVLAEAAPGQAAYPGSVANGVESRDWGDYGRSFTINPKGPRASAMAGVAACTGFPSGAADVTCSCSEGSGTGSVWGSGPYTADSDICAAARHSGVIGATGDVTAVAVEAQSAYAGSEANGVTTRDWGSYGESFDFGTDPWNDDLQGGPTGPPCKRL